MKKIYWMLTALAVSGVVVLTSFKEGDMTPEQKQQEETIDSLVQVRLDSFRVVKDEECQARAMQIAVVRADSVMMAKKGGKSTTKKGADPVPTKPEVKKEPTSKGEKSREKRGEEDTPSKGERSEEKRGEENKPSKGERSRAKRDSGGGK